MNIVLESIVFFLHCHLLISLVVVVRGAKKSPFIVDLFLMSPFSKIKKLATCVLCVCVCVCVCVCIVNLHWVKIFPIYKNPKVWETELQV